MRGFVRSSDGGGYTAELEPVEAALLTQLASQVAGLLSTGPSVDSGADGVDSGADAALLRLLPDAYADDADSAAEFRRFTSDDLSATKVQNAQTVIVDVSEALVAEGPEEVRLDDARAGAWVRALTDIRLVLAVRLGIDVDGMPTSDGDEAFMLGDVYDWLGWVQQSLVEAFDS